jgi:hypothetical protein
VSYSATFVLFEVFSFFRHIVRSTGSFLINGLIVLELGLAFIMYIRHILAVGALALIHAATADLPQVLVEGESPITDAQKAKTYRFSDVVLGVRDANTASKVAGTSQNAGATAANPATQASSAAAVVKSEPGIYLFRCLTWTYLLTT